MGRCGCLHGTGLKMGRDAHTGGRDHRRRQETHCLGRERLRNGRKRTKEIWKQIGRDEKRQRQVRAGDKDSEMGAQGHWDRNGEVPQTFRFPD